MFMAAASGGSVCVGAGGMKTFSVLAVLAAIMIEQCGTPGLYSPKMLTRPVTGP
jgi:hypothetical protein